MRDRTRSLARLLAVVCAMTACDLALGPQRDSLRELQRAAGEDTGTVIGKVYVAGADWPDTVSLYQPNTPRTPLPGAVVELGLWNGPTESFRDTVRGGPPTDMNDERFQVVARSTTDETGAYRFPGLPKKTSFAMRVRPPSGHGAQPGYLGTLFWLYTSSGMNLVIVLRHEPPVRAGN